jgi:hypothetical protein
MRLRNILSLLALATIAGCATTDSDSAPQTARPDIQVRQSGPIYFGSGSVAPVTLDVDIANPTAETLTIRRVRLESPGMGQYSLYPVTREFRETLNPGQQTSVSLSARATTSIARLNPTEPLTIRAIIEYEDSTGKRRREIYHTYAQQ